MKYKVYDAKFKLFNLIYIKFTDIIADTDKALKFRFDNGTEHWFPKAYLAFNAENKILAAPSTFVAERELLEYRIEPKHKISEGMLKMYQLKKRYANT